MVRINYQSYTRGKGFKLRLRLYDGVETRYINVNKFLQGEIKAVHWNQKKQVFRKSCPFYEQNNEIIVAFRKKYEKMTIDWEGSLFELALQAEDDVDNGTPVDSVQAFINGIVDNLKADRHPDGSMKCTFENYEKIGRRIAEFCEYKKKNYATVRIGEITPAFVDALLDWVREKRDGKCLRNISVTLHAIVARADKQGIVKLDDYKNCGWITKKPVSSQKYHTLNEAQCRMLANLSFDDDFLRFKYNRLYKDAALLMLYTGQSPCDVLSMKYSSIQVIDGVEHFIFKRRKIDTKQSVPCSIPVSKEMSSIMKFWKGQSKDGYVLPIRSDELTKKSHNNLEIRNFIMGMNKWLKVVGKKIGCSFPLHTYTFRHTAITRYISAGVPMIYVANMMGTSVENCRTIYYNNHGDTESRNKVLEAMASMEVA